MNSFKALWSGLPRAAKWAVYTTAAIILYFAVIEPVLSLTASYRNDANRIEAALRREGELSSPDSDDGKLLANARKIFGAPISPSDPGARPEALWALVNRVLRDHGIEDPVINEHSAALQIKPGDAGVGLAGPGQSILRFALDVTFEADPETAVMVIADFEAASEVTAIGRVRIDKGSVRFGSSRSSTGDEHDTTVRVTLSPEMWVRGRNDTDAGGGGGL